MSKKSSRKSIVSGIVGIVLSIAMLIGVTYAAFTDTSSTGVNTIQAGTLKVDLVDGNGNSLEGETVDFIGGPDLLWEPYGTYTHNTVYVKNSGDLNLKFKIIVNGINGTDGLDEWIDWSVSVDGNAEDLSTYEQVLEPQQQIPVVLVGTLDPETPEELMGAEASEISITVLATQNHPDAVYPTA